MFQQDYILRQIEMLTAAIARIVFHRDTVTYEQPAGEVLTEGGGLRGDLIAMIGQGRLGEAEDLLFQHLRPGGREELLIAMDFYERLTRLTDEELARGRFSREEILQSLTDAAGIFGVHL